MKALSIYQPWALLILLGAKRYETRSWVTPYRGPLVIHASRKFSEAAHALCDQSPVRGLLREAGFHDPWTLPRGALLGTVELSDCLAVEELGPVAEAERVLGDFRPGRFAWVLSQPVRFPEPRPLRGWPGLFSLEEATR